jgi:hypothetical protein
VQIVRGRRRHCGFSTSTATRPTRSANPVPVPFPSAARAQRAFHPPPPHTFPTRLEHVRAMCSRQHSRATHGDVTPDQQWMKVNEWGENILLGRPVEEEDPGGLREPTVERVAPLTNLPSSSRESTLATSFWFRIKWGGTTCSRHINSTQKFPVLCITLVVRIIRMLRNKKNEIK